MSERKAEDIASDLAEVTARIQATDQFIARLTEQRDRATIRRGHLLVEKADLLGETLPLKWIPVGDLPNFQEAPRQVDLSTSQLEAELEEMYAEER